MKKYELKQGSPDLSLTPPNKFLIDYDKELNPQQLAVVKHLNGALLVIAGAGSGKTRALTYRVSYLLEHGVHPKSILLLTFTRKAATEMMQRAANVLDERCLQVVGGTFHAFANRTLRKYAHLLGFSSNFTILDRSDAADCIQLFRNELGFAQNNKYFPKKNTLLSIHSKKINTGKELFKILETDYPNQLDEEQAIQSILEHYQKYKKEHGFMDYDDLLVYLRDLLQEHPSVQKKLSLDFQFIMVDEYQDTNHLQFEIIRLLAIEHGNLMVVGDDSQCIYTFRGADYRNIMDFPKVYPDCKVVTLEQNYRSTQPILHFTNQIFQSSEDRYDKQLFSNLQGKQKPIFLQARNEFEEAQFACQRILELNEKGISLNEIAVLFRSGFNSNILEIELKNHRIPFVKYGGMRFVDAAHVKDLIALLRISFQQTDAISWYRVLLLLEGIGAKSAKQLVDEITSQQKGLQALVAPIREKKKYYPALKELHELLVQSFSEAPEKRLEAFLGYYQPILEKKYDRPNERKRDLESLVRIATRYEDLSSFLAEMALEPPEKSLIEVTPKEQSNEKLTLSTIHSAKGLEWHTVFLIHLTDGVLPSAQSVANEDLIQEERRLFYVATTRAKHNLYLLASHIGARGGSYHQPSTYSFSKPSRFLAEMENFRENTEEWVLS